MERVTFTSQAAHRVVWAEQMREATMPFSSNTTPQAITFGRVNLERQAATRPTASRWTRRVTRMSLDGPAAACLALTRVARTHFWRNTIPREASCGAASRHDRWPIRPPQWGRDRRHRKHFHGGETHGSLFGTHLGEFFNDTFLAKYDAAGNQLWARQPVTSDHETEVRLAVDRAGNAYISNRRTQVQGGNLDISLTKYDAAGSVQWNKQFAADATLDFVGGLSVDDVGNIYMAGTGFDASSRVFTGSVAKYDASGDIS